MLFRQKKLKKYADMQEAYAHGEVVDGLDSRFHIVSAKPFWGINGEIIVYHKVITDLQVGQMIGNLKIRDIFPNPANPSEGFVAVYQ